MDDQPSLFLSAGDPSGDNAAARLLTHLKDKHADLEVFGLGGERLAKLGQRQLAPGSELAVLGFWEVARRYAFFRKLFYRCVDEITSRRPKAVLLVDYPGFNLRLAAAVKQMNIPVLYYISPQVWAWGRGRVEKIRRHVDRMLCILPFEQKFFADRSVPADFVGHYLVEDIPNEYIASNTPDNKPSTLALLPGSRRQEVERMLPVMAQAGQAFAEKYGVRVVVAGVQSIDRLFSYEACLVRTGATKVEVEFDNARKILYESSLAVVASGTATLETGIIGRPMVVIYKTGGATYQIARRLVKLKMIGLVNLVLGEKVVPELIQGGATPEAIVDELERFWRDEGEYDSVAGKLRHVAARLGGPGASARAAEIVSEYLQ